MTNNSYASNTIFSPSRLVNFQKKFPFLDWKGEYPFINPYTKKPHNFFHYMTNDKSNRLGQDIRNSILFPMGNKIRWVASDPIRSTAAGSAIGGLLGALYGISKKDSSTLSPLLLGALLGGGGTAGAHYIGANKHKWFK